MDTFECYCRNKAAMTTIKQGGCHGVTALHHPAQAARLSYHGNRIIHSRIANADIQVF